MRPRVSSRLASIWPREGVLSTVAIIAFALLGASTKANSEETPNIVLILTDDQGWSQISTAMDPQIPGAASDYLETPNMERLAKRGMRFQSAYSPAPLCTPTRRSIQCGMTPARQHITDFKDKGDNRYNWTNRMTIAKALKSVDRNYKCGHFGKLGIKPKNTQFIGYDKSHGNTGNKDGGSEDGTPLIVDDPKLTTTVTCDSINFMKESVSSGNPFYVQLSYYAVHLKVQTRQAKLGKYVKKGQPDRAVTQGWAAMLEDLDDGVGHILDTIEELGIGNNTYVFFTSDNGGRGEIPGADNSLSAPNRPLSGAKGSLYEGGIRVPFIVMGPRVEAGSVSRAPVVGYDFLPTFYDLAGGRKPLPDDIDGGSLRTVLMNGGVGEVKRPNDGVIFHHPHRKRDPQSVIRMGHWKLMLHWQGPNRWNSELFNLAEDIGEKNDLSKQHPETAERLERLLLKYLDQVDAQRPGDA